MKLLGNELFNNEKTYVVGYESSKSNQYNASLTIFNSSGKNITEENLTNWEFSEFPELSEENSENEISIINNKTGETGYVSLVSYNNGCNNSCYWAHTI